MSAIEMPISSNFQINPKGKHKQWKGVWIRRFDWFSQEGLLAEYLSRLKAGASLQEPQLMTCDCLSSAHREETGKGTPTPCAWAERGVETLEEKKGRVHLSLSPGSRDVCGRPFLTDTRSPGLDALLCGCARAGTMSHLTSVTLCLIGCLLAGNAGLPSLCLSGFCSMGLQGFVLCLDLLYWWWLGS